MDIFFEEELSVSEISSRVGYNSLACFYLAWRKHFGTLPSEHRAYLNTKNNGDFKK
ncbi:MAG: helix-turn-helix transcriptional regulator [Clostridia bacterium]|nr:helix-turn-helix transcriptional regulator [Clostridia bacterium]